MADEIQLTSLKRMRIPSENIETTMAAFVQQALPSSSAALQADTTFTRFMNNEINYTEYLQLNTTIEEEDNGEVMDDIPDLPLLTPRKAESGQRQSPPKRKRARGKEKAIFTDLTVPADLRAELQIDDESGEFLSNQAEEVAPAKVPRQHIRRGNKTVDSLVGQANLACANNRIEEALSFLKEAIRQDPRLPQGYRQMADIYADQNQLSRAFEYRLMAAHLDSHSTASDWAEVGEMATKLQRIEEAAACFGKAIKCDPNSWFYYEKRIELLEALGLHKFAMKVRLQAAQSIDCKASNVDFEWLQSLIKSAAEYYIDCLDEERAMEALKIFLLRCYEFNRTADAQHLALLGMFINRNNYEECAKSILALCPGVRALNADGTDSMKITVTNSGYTFEPFFPDTVDRFTVEESVNTIVLTKFIICLQHMGKLSPLASLIDVLLNRAVHDNEEESAFLDIGRSAFELEYYSHGLQFMRKLLQIESFARNADALYICGTFEQAKENEAQALELYKRALEFNPAFVNARINYSSLLQKTGKVNEALDALMDYDVDACAQLPDERLLIRQVEALHAQKHYEQYIRCLRMLLVPHFYQIYCQRSLIKRTKGRVLESSTVVHTMMDYLRGTAIEKQIKRQGAVALGEQRDTDELSVNDLHDYCLRLIEALCEKERYSEMLAAVCLAHLQPRIRNQGKTTFQNMLLFACLKAHNYTLAFEHLRYIYQTWMTRSAHLEPHIAEQCFVRLFNAMNFVFCQHQSVAYHRFIMRAEVRSPQIWQLQIISGNNSLVTGSYRHALSEYMRVWARNRDDPLSTLLVGLTFIHLASKKDISGRHMIALRGVSFISRYARLREGPRQEVLYNIGRMLHQLGIFAGAAHFYEKVLYETKPPMVITVHPRTGEKVETVHENYDLRPCAAHNLSRIYINSGNSVRASQIMEEFCTL